MPIKGDITKESYVPQIRAFNPAQETSTFKATFEYVLATFKIRFFWYSEPSELEFFDNGKEIVRKDGKSWKTEGGFSVGDLTRIQWGIAGIDTAFTGDCNITGISEDGFSLFTDFNQALLNGIVVRNEDLAPGGGILVTGLTALDNAKYSFGLNENSENFNFQSKLTGEDQTYLIKNIVATPTVGEISGTIKGWASGIGTPTAEKLVNTKIPVLRGANFGAIGGVVADGVQNFEIKHTLPVIPFYTVGQLQNLKDGIAPPFLQGNKSLAYRFQVELTTSISTEEGEKIVRLTTPQGSTGFFGENFNGIQTQYSKDSISYIAGGQPNDSLLASGVTNVTAIVNSSEGTFTSGQNIIVTHSYLPLDETEYIGKTTEFEPNFVFDAIEKDSSGFIVQNVTTTVLSSGSQLQIDFDIDTSGSPVELTAESNYLLYVVLDDDAKAADDSDRTAIVLDINVYDLNPDIPDLLIVDEAVTYNHITDDNLTGFTDYKGWIQDGYEVKGSFRLDRSKFAFLNTFFIDLVAWEDGTNNYFTIQSNQYNLTGALINGDGNQEINIEETQGFQLDELDQFNKKDLTTGSFDGTFITYEFALGLKINWQDWLSLPEAANVFVDAGEPNNGKNQNTSRYSLKQGYTVQTILRADVLETEQDIVTEYIHKIPMVVNDFEEDASQDWSGTIQTENEDNNNDANGSILGAGKGTIIKAVFTPNFAITPDPNDFEGIIRIVEQLPQGDKTIYELSSVRTSQANNLLIPLVGESLTKVSVVGSDVILECRTDKTLIQDVNYTVSARLFGPASVVIGDYNDDFSNDFFV